METLRNEETSCYTSLGNVHISVGEHEKAKEHLEKSVVIQKEIGDRSGEATSYANLGAVYTAVGEYEKAREYLEKSVVIQKEIGDRNGEASDPLTQTFGLCIQQLANMRRLENISRNHL